MGLFLKLNARLSGLYASSYGERHHDTDLGERWLNVEHATDIHDDPPRKQLVSGTAGKADAVYKDVPVTAIHYIYNAPSGEGSTTYPNDTHQFIAFADGKAADIIARIEKLRAGTCECDDMPVQPVSPTRLGYIYVPNNTKSHYMSVNDLDTYDEIEFVVRAGGTAADVLTPNMPARIKVPRSDIPISTNPFIAPRLTLAVPRVGNVFVGRMADGSKLYFIGDDQAEVSAIEVYGHKA